MCAIHSALSLEFPYIANNFGITTELVILCFLNHVWCVCYWVFSMALDWQFADLLFWFMHSQMAIIVTCFAHCRQARKISWHEQKLFLLCDTAHVYSSCFQDKMPCNFGQRYITSLGCFQMLD